MGEAVVGVGVLIGGGGTGGVVPWSGGRGIGGGGTGGVVPWVKQ